MRVEGKRTERRSGEPAGTGTRSLLAVAETHNRVNGRHGPISSPDGSTRTHRQARGCGSCIPATQFNNGGKMPPRGTAPAVLYSARAISGPRETGDSFRRELELGRSRSGRQARHSHPSVCGQAASLAARAIHGRAWTPQTAAPLATHRVRHFIKLRLLEPRRRGKLRRTDEMTRTKIDRSWAADRAARRHN